MKIFIIAGEASGDVHGANLMKAMLIQDPNIEFEFWGGDKMNEVQPTLKKHYRDLAFMGFIEVVMNIRTIRKNFKLCKEHINTFGPDKVIFIDYPGFNLRMASWVKKKGIETIYYIAPQVWAWHRSRVKKIKQFIDKMFVILPFEKSFFDKEGYEVIYAGNPILDEIHAFRKDDGFLERYRLTRDKIIAILPGSRNQEISEILPIMLDISQYYPDMIFCISVKSSIDAKLYKAAIPTKHGRNIRIIKDDHLNLLAHSKAALVTSGTATLETALLNVPQVVCYKGNKLTVAIAKRLVDIKYISLVNLILDKPIICELIQNELTTENLRKELDLILGPQRGFVLKGYEELKERMGKPGASAKIAKNILS